MPGHGRRYPTKPIIPLKFSLATLLLLIALACVALGWFADRSRLNARLAEGDSKLESVISGGLWWGMAEQARQFSVKLRESPDQLQMYNRRNLVTKIFWLFRFQSDVDAWSDNPHSGSGKSAASLAGDLLMELECESHAEFEPLFRERFEDQFTEYFDPTTEDYEEMKIFIETSLESYSSIRAIRRLTDSMEHQN